MSGKPPQKQRRIKMPRPKANTPEGKLASEKWRKTMIEKYGSITSKMREVGRIGGQNGKGPDYKGGFAGDRERARLAGARGGAKSRRTSKYEAEMQSNLEYIKEHIEHKTIKELSSELGIPYSSLAHFISKITK